MNFTGIILTCLALGFAHSVSGNEPLKWELRPEAQVDSTGIFLDQLVALNSQTALPQIRLSAAPALGQTTSLTRAQVIELVGTNLSELTATKVTGAAQVRVRRRTRSLPAIEMLSMLVSALQKDFVKDRGELEVNLPRPWTPVLVPDEPLTLKVIDVPATGLSANFIVRFEIWNGKEQIGSWNLAAQARLWREIPVARTGIARGQLVRDADATLERRDLLLHRDAFLNFPTLDESLEVTETIQAGMPLLNRSIKARPAVRRGKLVEAVYQDGGLSISLKVETLEDGLIGQTVRVRNPKTKRELFGKVQNEQTILITL